MRLAHMDHVLEGIADQLEAPYDPPPDAPILRELITVMRELVRHVRESDEIIRRRKDDER